MGRLAGLPPKRPRLPGASCGLMSSREWERQRLSTFLLADPFSARLQGEPPVVMRQSHGTLQAMGVKEGSVVRFWNGKNELK